MGSILSGRWHNHTKAELAEHAFSFSLQDIKQCTGRLKPELFWRDTLHLWVGTDLLLLSFTLDMRTSSPFLAIAFTSPATRQQVSSRIALTTTTANFGGVCYWLSCPALSASYTPCTNRCLKLFLPPPALYFSCFSCSKLTYRSCQQSHSRYAGMSSEFRQLLARDQQRKKARCVQAKGAG
jgi:hypothetical protein